VIVAPLSFNAPPIALITLSCAVCLIVVACGPLPAIVIEFVKLSAPCVSTYVPLASWTVSPFCAAAIAPRKEQPLGGAGGVQLVPPVVGSSKRFGVYVVAA
jgi:hypothetical protein